MLRFETVNESETFIEQYFFGWNIFLNWNIQKSNVSWLEMRRLATTLAVVVVVVVVVVVIVQLVDKGGFKHDEQRRRGIVERENGRDVYTIYPVE